MDVLLETATHFKGMCSSGESFKQRIVRFHSLDTFRIVHTTAALTIVNQINDDQRHYTTVQNAVHVFLYLLSSSVSFPQVFPIM